MLSQMKCDYVFSSSRVDTEKLLHIKEYIWNIVLLDRGFRWFLGPSNQNKLYHYQKYEVWGDNPFNMETFLRFLGLNSEMQ